MKETDLCPPVSELLEHRGYLVHAEVKSCDITAIQGEELVIVELKTSVNIKLLIQATDRLSMTSLVYIAVPEPARPGAHWRGIVRLLKMLGLGLILVSFGQTGARARVEFSPHPYKPTINKKKSKSVISEALNRSANYNLGGSKGIKLITTYRESSIYVACCLQLHGSLAPRDLKLLGSGDKTQSILYKNHYGWFEKVDRGLYRLSEKGTEEIIEYPEIRDRAYTLLEQN